MATLFAIDKRTFYGGTSIRDFHAAMFHGYAQRGGQSTLLKRGPDFRDNVIEPLELTKNIFQLAGVIQPAIWLVVKHHLKERLENLPSLKFVQVIFKKLIDYAFYENDFSVYRNPGFTSSESFINLLPSRPDLLATIDDYYEVISPHWADIVDQFNDTTEISVPMPLSVDSTPLRANVSTRMFDTFPMLWHDHAILLSSDAYEILRPEIQQPYFMVTQVNY